MKNLLILLLFALVHSGIVDGIQAYGAEHMQRLTEKDVYLLTVKKGEEFYIRFYGNPRAFYYWRIENYEKIPHDALDDFDKKGQFFKYVPITHGGYPVAGAGGTLFFKFKALRESKNEISLKFVSTLQNTQVPYTIIKINIE